MGRRVPVAVAFGFFALVLLCNLPGFSRAEVNLNINIGPPVVVEEPAEVVLIPSIGVYFVPGGEVDLFFHAGFWWSPRGDRWYRASAYNGPWVVVERRIVPGHVIRIPRDYRVRYVKEKHVPYGQWKKSHGRREHDDGHYGDRHPGKNHKRGKRGHGRGDE